MPRSLWGEAPIPPVTFAGTPSFLLAPKDKGWRKHLARAWAAGREGSIEFHPPHPPFTGGGAVVLWQEDWGTILAGSTLGLLEEFPAEGWIQRKAELTEGHIRQQDLTDPSQYMLAAASPWHCEKHSCKFNKSPWSRKSCTRNY